MLRSQIRENWNMRQTINIAYDSVQLWETVFYYCLSCIMINKLIHELIIDIHRKAIPKYYNIYMYIQEDHIND